LAISTKIILPILSSWTGKCEITSVTSIEGEASANNRKAKLIFFYEWVIKGEWSGISGVLAYELKNMFLYMLVSL